MINKENSTIVFRNHLLLNNSIKSEIKSSSLQLIKYLFKIDIFLTINDTIDNRR